MEKRKVKEPVKKSRVGKTKIKKAVKKVIKKKMAEKKEEPVIAIEKVLRFSSLEGRFLHVKVGDAHKPAEEKEIKEIREGLEKVFNANDINCIAFVSHHAVEITIY